VNAINAAGAARILAAQVTAALPLRATLGLRWTVRPAEDEAARAERLAAWLQKTWHLARGHETLGCGCNLCQARFALTCHPEWTTLPVDWRMQVDWGWWQPREDAFRMLMRVKILLHKSSWRRSQRAPRRRAARQRRAHERARERALVDAKLEAGIDAWLGGQGCLLPPP